MVDGGVHQSGDGHGAGVDDTCLNGPLGGDRVGERSRLGEEQALAGRAGGLAIEQDRKTLLTLLDRDGLVEAPRQRPPLLAVPIAAHVALASPFARRSSHGVSSENAPSTSVAPAASSLGTGW